MENLFSRRGFLGAAAACAVGLALPAGAQAPKKIRLAAQLYSLRGIVRDVHGFYAMLRLLKAFGYSGVEFAGVWGTPQELKARLADQAASYPILTQ